MQNLNENNGYIVIKLGKIKIIQDFQKILHIINITEFERNRNEIKNSIDIIGKLIRNDDPTFLTTVHNFNLLDAKIHGLKPHERNKRGLLNVVGKGLKILTGTMDSDDESIIKEKLEILSKTNHDLVNESNKQITINSKISEQIRNISEHINKQQKTITDALLRYTNKTQEEATSLQKDLEMFGQLYQINYDITLLRSHIDDIEQIILTSKLNILSRNILSDKELEMVSDIEALKDIKITVAYYDKKIVLIIFIPIYSTTDFYNVLIEPLPDNLNKSIILKENLFIIDSDKNVYNLTVKVNLKLNLIKFNDECVSKILKGKEAECEINSFKKEEVKEIIPGLIILKNNKNNSIIQDCNNENLKLFRNTLISFENCKVHIKNITYSNTFYRINDYVKLPHINIKINKKPKIDVETLEELHLTDFKNDRKIIEEIISTQNSRLSTIHILITLSGITFIIFISITFYKIYYNFKITKQNQENLKTSSELRTNDGGVTIHPAII